MCKSLYLVSTLASRTANQRCVDFRLIFFEGWFEFRHIGVFFSTNGGLRSGWSISGLKSTLSHWFFWAIQRWTWCCVSDHCPAIWVLWPSHHDLMVRHHPCGFSGAEQNSQLHQLQRVALVQPESAKLKSESPTRNTDMFKQSVWWT